MAKEQNPEEIIMKMAEEKENKSKGHTERHDKHYTRDWEVYYHCGGYFKIIQARLSKILPKYYDSDKVFISIKFDYENETYKSWIVLTFRKYDNDNNILSSEEMFFETPRLELIGGVWSNIVALRMLKEQILISTTLEVWYWQIKHIEYYLCRLQDFEDYLHHLGIRNTEYKPLIIKVDRCLYAPALYFSGKKNERIVMSFLTERYPEAVKYAHNTFGNYLKDYHDKDVEEKFNTERT